MVERALVRVFRFDPEKDDKPRYKEYDVPVEEGMSVLRALRYIYEHFDGSLAFRDYFCRTNQCGMCGMLVNGKPAFACNRKLEKETTIEPLAGFPVIKDLIVDFGKKTRCTPDQLLVVRSGTITKRYRSL